MLVTQSFGTQNEYRRAIFAIWSYWIYLPNGKVMLFTDNPDFFKPYFSEQPIEYILLTAEKIKAMRGEIDFLHRMKIALIEEAFSKALEANLLYLDSDTFFIDNPSSLLQKLSPTIAFMHTREYAFEEVRKMPLPAGKTFQKFVGLIEANSFLLTDGSQFKVTTNQASWNAGVMFFHPSHSAFLPDVYTLTDQFYPATQNHASEQYAFSIVMQNRTNLHPCDKVVYHYWYRIKKEIMDVFLLNEIHHILHMTKEEKVEWFKRWTKRLPILFENHVFSLRDQAIQSFHEKKYMEGYGYSFRALMKSPLNKKFLYDLSYHTKKMIYARFN